MADHAAFTGPIFSPHAVGSENRTDWLYSRAHTIRATLVPTSWAMPRVSKGERGIHLLRDYRLNSKKICDVSSRRRNEKVRHVRTWSFGREVMRRLAIPSSSLKEEIMKICHSNPWEWYSWVKLTASWIQLHRDWRRKCRNSYGNAGHRRAQCKPHIEWSARTEYVSLDIVDRSSLAGMYGNNYGAMEVIWRG